MEEETYPSGRVVKNAFEADGDLMRISSKATAFSTERTYADSFAYTPAGAIERLQLGNGRWENAKFNTRLQITELGLGTSATNLNLWKVNYDYGELAANGVDVTASQNTGNIAKQTISFQGLANPFVQTYRYDSLNRLSEAKEMSGINQTWKQVWKYDRYGNRERVGSLQQIGNISSPLTPQNNLTFPTIDANTNRFSDNQGYGYDANGNIITDASADGTRNFTFDGDNKQTEVKLSGNLLGKYFYDGEGKRVKKHVYSSGVVSEVTVFVYSSGKLIAEYSTAAPPQNPTTNYVATDILQSVRAISNTNGDVTSRRDFMPFGEEILADGQSRTTANKYLLTLDGIRQKFTGYEKDEETKLDFAEARYYNNQHGRFTAVDPLLASGKSANPQTFNRYAYTGNNPVNITDPLGLDWYFNSKENRYDWYDEDTKTFKYSDAKMSDAWSILKGNNAHVYEDSINGGYVALDARSSNYLAGIETKEAALKQAGVWFNNDPASRSLVNEVGSRGDASMKFIGLFALASASGGAAAVGAVGTPLFYLVIGAEAFTAQQSLRDVAENEHQTSLMMGTISADRQYAVRHAWKQEAEQIRQTGQGTRSWTQAEMREILETGKVQGYEGHHINSVNEHPELARDPNNIRFVRGRAEHLQLHEGNFRNSTKGPLIPRIRR